jgi:hypothetical protein
VNYFVIHLHHDFHFIELIQLISMNKRKIFCFYITGSINVTKIIGLINLHKLCKIYKFNTKRIEKNNFARKGRTTESIICHDSSVRLSSYRWNSHTIFKFTGLDFFLRSSALTRSILRHKTVEHRYAILSA